MARILIIEDEADQAELYRMALEGAGHQVEAGDDFKETRLPKGSFDLVMLDERLGGRSGSALIPEIRRVWPDSRILILTADPDVAEAAVSKGADEGRMKPVLLRQLVSGVEALLSRKR